MNSSPDYSGLKAFRIFHIILPAILTLAWATQSFGDPEVAPDLPLVAPAPDPGSWTVDVKQKNPLPPKSIDPKVAVLQAILARSQSRMVRQTVEKAGRDWHGETLWEDGTKDTYWLYHDMIMFQPRTFPSDRLLVVSDKVRGAPKKPDQDFPDLEWISPQFFVGAVTYAGQKCYLYKETPNAPPKAVDSEASPQVHVSAWINATTRLPVALEDNATLKTYTFHPAPTSIEPQGLFASRYKSLPKDPTSLLDEASPSSTP